MNRGSLLFALLLPWVASCDDDGGEPELVFSLPDDEYWRDTRTFPPAGDRIVITNNLSDELSVLDLDAVDSPDFGELMRVPVGRNPVEREGPHHLAAEASGEFYYVGISNYVPGSGSGPHGVHGAGTADGHVLKIRSTDHLAVDEIRVDRNPGDIRLSPDGRRLLVSHFDLLKIAEAVTNHLPPEAMDARLGIIDTANFTATPTMVTVCPAPHGIAVSPDGRYAYLSCISDELARVTLDDPAAAPLRLPVLANPGPATAPVCSPYALTIPPAGDSVWVSCLESGELLRYDVASGAMDPGSRILLPGGALFGTFTTDGANLFVPHQAPDGIAFIDANERRLLFDLQVERAACINPHATSLTDDQRKLLVVCEGDHSGPGSLLVVDVAGRTVEKSVPLGRFPDDLAFVRAAP